MFADLGRLQKFCWVVITIAVKLQKTEETPDTAQDATLRAGMDADIVQSGREVLQVFERHLAHVLLFALQVVEQFAQVALIGVECMTRHVALQLQVAYVVLDDIFLHL